VVSTIAEIIRLSFVVVVIVIVIIITTIIILIIIITLAAELSESTSRPALPSSLTSLTSQLHRPIKIPCHPRKQHRPSVEAKSKRA
jgi:hypothetical protein